MNGCRWYEVYRKNISNSLVLVVFHDQKLAIKLQIEASSVFCFCSFSEILHVLRKCLLGPFALIIDDCDAFNKIFECFTPFLGYLKNCRFFDFLHVDCGGGGCVHIFDSYRFFCFLMSTMRFFFISDCSRYFPKFFKDLQNFSIFACGGGWGAHWVFIGFI